MNDNRNIEQIESSVVALAAAYAAGILGMIFWLAN
jgi:hypothetical protein